MGLAIVGSRGPGIVGAGLGVAPGSLEPEPHVYPTPRFLCPSAPPALLSTWLVPGSRPGVLLPEEGPLCSQAKTQCPRVWCWGAQEPDFHF